jgi:hypothetical protein
MPQLWKERHSWLRDRSGVYLFMQGYPYQIVANIFSSQQLGVSSKRHPMEGQCCVDYILLFRFNWS